MPTKILCTTDSSKTAQKGVAYAVGLAKKNGGSLTFLNVAPSSARRAARTYFWDQEILVEYIGGSPYVDGITLGGFKIDAEGYLEIPAKPGLGIDLDRAALAKYTPDPTPLFKP